MLGERLEELSKCGVIFPCSVQYFLPASSYPQLWDFLKKGCIFVPNSPHWGCSIPHAFCLIGFFDLLMPEVGKSSFSHSTLPRSPFASSSELCNILLSPK